MTSFNYARRTVWRSRWPDSRKYIQGQARRMARNWVAPHCTTMHDQDMVLLL